MVTGHSCAGQDPARSRSVFWVEPLHPSTFEGTLASSLILALCGDGGDLPDTLGFRGGISWKYSSSSPFFSWRESGKQNTNKKTELDSDHKFDLLLPLSSFFWWPFPLKATVFSFTKYNEFKGRKLLSSPFELNQPTNQPDTFCLQVT